MQIRKIVRVRWLLAALAVAGTLSNKSFAQQTQDANSGEKLGEFLRFQTEALKFLPSEQNNSKPKVNLSATSGEVLGVLFEGDTNVPDDEHMETWVSRALSIYAQTDDQESRAMQREEIAKGLNTIFDLRHQQRVSELRELEARVQKLKTTLDQRAASKTEIVKKRLEYLIREADGLGWGDGIPSPKRSGPTGIRFSTGTSPEPITGVIGIDASLPKTEPVKN